MKICTNDQTTGLNRWTYLLEAMLLITFMMIAATVSQSLPAIVTFDANAISNPSELTSVDNDLAPKQFQLFQNNPNPFNPSTRIQFSLEKAAQVSLKVYNLIGREIVTLVNSRQEAGSYTVLFNINKGSFDFSSGIYFYRIEAGSFVSTRKLVLMK